MSNGNTSPPLESQLIKTLVETVVFKNKHIDFLENTIDGLNRLKQIERRGFVVLLRNINKYHPNVISSEQLEQLETAFNVNIPSISLNGHQNSCGNNCNGK
jgi:hypothetical protein